MPTTMGNGHDDGDNNAMTTAATMRRLRQQLNYIDNCNGAKIDATIATERQ
jgi:hypothetical protein